MRKRGPNFARWISDVPCVLAISLVAFTFAVVRAADSPPNPLGASNAKPQTADEVIALYTVINAMPAGKMVQRRVAGANEHDGLLAGLRDVGTVLGAQLDVQGYANKTDHVEWALFTCKQMDPPQKGFVLSRLDKDGANLLIICARADTSPADLSLLVSGPKMKEYTFPDGTGSVSVPDGWTCNSQGYVSGVQVEGPGGREVRFYDHFNVNTPDNPMVQIQMRNGNVTGLVAPFSSPVDSIKNLWQQLARTRQQQGQPVMELEKIISATDPVAGTYPNGKQSVIVSLWAEHSSGGVQQIRIRSRIETHAYNATTWERVAWVNMIGPDETFDADLPTMTAIASSLKQNTAKITQIGSANAAARLDAAKATVKANAEVAAAREDYFNARENDSLIQSRSNTDFDEIIRGDRTVVDTQTGQSREVDLFNSHDIVATLNQGQPDRFVELPLRDQLYPLTPQ